MESLYKFLTIQSITVGQLIITLAILWFVSYIIEWKKDVENVQTGTLDYINAHSRHLTNHETRLVNIERELKIEADVITNPFPEDE